MTHEEFLEAWGKKPIYNKDGKERCIDALVKLVRENC